jgi:hypothetical protein
MIWPAVPHQDGKMADGEGACITPIRSEPAFGPAEHERADAAAAAW